MTLPDRLITLTPRDKTSASNELTDNEVIHIVAEALGIVDRDLDQLRHAGVRVITGDQLTRIAKTIASLSSAASRAEHAEALAQADERWRERLDLAVEALRLYRDRSGRGDHAPLGRIADALAIGGSGKTNLRVTLESRLGVKPDLAAEAADAAIEAILARLANPRSVLTEPLSHADAVRGMQP